MALAMLLRGNVRGSVLTLGWMWLLGMLCGGAFDSLPTTLFGVGRRHIRYEGSCEPGFEAVELAFRRHFDLGVERQAQCVAYVNGRKVVDICGAVDAPSTRDYGADTIQYIFSTSKAVTSIVLAMLVDRGRIAYEQAVADVWPEFAQHGKGDITLAELLRHEAGCAVLEPPLPVADLTTERIKQGAASDALAAMVPSWPKGRGVRREYHPETRGLLLNEVVRRIDSRKRTVREFVADEIARPLGVSDSLYVGAPDEADHRVAPVTPFPLVWGALHAALPSALGGLTCFDPIVFTLVHLMPLVRLRPVSREKPSFAIDPARPSGYPHDTFNLGRYNDVAARRAEVPSSNMHASARALARVGAAVAAACSGEALDAAALLSQRGAQEAHARPVTLPTWFHVTTSFTNAGFNVFSLPHGLAERGGFVGWMGLGGSILLWHPKRNMSFAYTCTGFEVCDNRRSQVLQQVFLHCCADLERSA